MFLSVLSPPWFDLGYCLNLYSNHLYRIGIPQIRFEFYAAVLPGITHSKQLYCRKPAKNEYNRWVE